MAVPLLLASGASFGQTPEKPLSFEVASVKPASAPIATKDDYSAGFNAGMRAALASAGLRIVGQRVNVTDNSLRDLIRLAYQVKDYQITAPAWMSSEEYEIVANMPAGSNRNQAPEMLKTLLDTRFHLQFHKETKKMAVYALVAAKSGPKLTAVEGSANPRGGNAWTDSGVGHLRAQKSPIAALADLLTKVGDRPVIDGTGLTGIYDFDLTYSSELSATSTEATPSLTAALSALGLRLEKHDVQMEILVIERADKVPVEN
jgi:uncharacterized protein (TIGR03435 family)